MGLLEDLAKLEEVLDGHDDRFHFRYWRLTAARGPSVDAQLDMRCPVHLFERDTDVFYLIATDAAEVLLHVLDSWSNAPTGTGGQTRDRFSGRGVGGAHGCRVAVPLLSGPRCFPRGSACPFEAATGMPTSRKYRFLWDFLARRMQGPRYI